MIRIESANEFVNVKVTLLGWEITFSNERTKTIDAILLKNEMRNKLYNSLKKVREEAYNQGWKDKTKRKRKETCFSGEF